MDSYKAETEEIIDRFLHHRLSYPECTAALDAALARLIPRLTAEKLKALRRVMLANSERVLREMDHRQRYGHRFFATCPLCGRDADQGSFSRQGLREFLAAGTLRFYCRDCDAEWLPDDQQRGSIENILSKPPLPSSALHPTILRNVRANGK